MFLGLTIFLYKFINPKTILPFYLNHNSSAALLSGREWLAVGAEQRF
jgi:hypothetical protein